MPTHPSSPGPHSGHTPAARSVHTHDDIDWSARVADLRRRDDLERDRYVDVAARLTRDLPADAVVVDVGCGAGGMGAALAAALRERGGGTLVLVDATEALLEAARATVVGAGGDPVRVETVHADLADAAWHAHVPAADLVWAAGVIHHLPDQQAAVDDLAGVLAEDGVLALAEGGLEPRFLPWDLGTGRPGLEIRVAAARDSWFGQLRAEMPDAVPMPYGWTTALARAGLTGAGSFASVTEHPPPVRGVALDHVLDHFAWVEQNLGERLAEQDRDTLRRLLDPDSADHLGRRDDVAVFDLRTIHTARRR